MNSWDQKEKSEKDSLWKRIWNLTGGPVAMILLLALFTTAGMNPLITLPLIGANGLLWAFNFWGEQLQQKVPIPMSIDEFALMTTQAVFACISLPGLENRQWDLDFGVTAGIIAFITLFVAWRQWRRCLQGFWFLEAKKVRVIQPARPRRRRIIKDQPKKLILPLH